MIKNVNFCTITQSIVGVVRVSVMLLARNRSYSVDSWAYLQFWVLVNSVSACIYACFQFSIFQNNLYYDKSS